MDNAEELDKQARASAERANQISAEYSKNTSTIIDRLIVIALGTSSLLFTFIGVLYSSEKTAKDLDFKYLLLAIGGFILASALLLFARWFPSLYRHSMAQKHYLSDLKKVEEEKQNLLKGGQLINTRTGNVFTLKEAKSLNTKLKKRVTKIDEAIKKNKNDENNYHRLYRYTFLTGVILIFVSYALTAIFSIGIISILNK